MRAAVCREFGQPLTIEEVQLAPPGSGQVQVDVAACAICHSDVTFIDGKWGGQLPAVYGHEAAGTVVACGDGVTDLQPGDRVAVTLIRSCGDCHQCTAGHSVQCSGFADQEAGPISDSSGNEIWQAMASGAFAEQVVVHRSQVIAIPDSVPFAEASLLSCGVITGFGAVTRASSASAASDVVVIGAGGVGINAIQGAKSIGARTVTAIDVSDDKLATLGAFGATHVVNSATEDATARIDAITERRGASHVFVTVGVGVAIELGLELLAVSGELVIVGMPPVGVELSFEPVNIAAASQRIIGTKMGEADIAVDIPRIIDLTAAGSFLLTELISGEFPLERINEAIDQVRNGQVIRNVITF